MNKEYSASGGEAPVCVFLLLFIQSFVPANNLILLRQLPGQSGYLPDVADLLRLRIVDGEARIPIFTGVVNHLEDAKVDSERLKRKLRRNRNDL